MFGDPSDFIRIDSVKKAFTRLSCSAERTKSNVFAGRASFLEAIKQALGAEGESLIGNVQLYATDLVTRNAFITLSKKEKDLEREMDGIARRDQIDSARVQLLEEIRKAAEAGIGRGVVRVPTEAEKAEYYASLPVALAVLLDDAAAAQVDPSTVVVAEVIEPEKKTNKKARKPPVVQAGEKLPVVQAGEKLPVVQAGEKKKKARKAVAEAPVVQAGEKKKKARKPPVVPAPVVAEEPEVIVLSD